ncbi:MAG TPA: hypothetical protein DCM05_00530 [Elusimicrobia bacterium]|nr:hypothetical protein [Elusimicrobiota bacterium]
MNGVRDAAKERRVGLVLCALAGLASVPTWWLSGLLPPALDPLVCDTAGLTAFFVVFPSALLLTAFSSAMFRAARKRLTGDQDRWLFWACLLLHAVPWTMMLTGFLFLHQPLVPHRERASCPSSDHVRG